MVQPSGPPQYTVSLCLATAFVLAIIAPQHLHAQEPGNHVMGDATPPQLVEFGFSPGEINVYDGAADIVFTLRVTDPFPGLSLLDAYTRLALQSPAGRQYNAALQLVAGDSRDGTYQAQITVPTDAETGAWRVQEVLLTDTAGNERRVSQADLSSMGFPSNLQVNRTAPAQALIANDDFVETDEDTPLLIAVLVNDSVSTGRKISITGVSHPARGVARASLNGVITYTPDRDYHGTDHFSYTIADGAGNTAEGNVTVVVRSINDPPGAFAITSPQAGENLTFNSDAQDQKPLVVAWQQARDPDGDPIAYTVLFSLNPSFSSSMDLLSLEAGAATRQEIALDALAMALKKRNVDLQQPAPVYLQVRASDTQIMTTSPTVALTVSRISTVASQSTDNAPASFALEGNYPNPFNPATSVVYTLPHPARVRLQVYDILGREVALLVDKHQPAGRHTIVWEARDEPGGVYVCRLEAGSFSRMTVLHLLK